MSTPPDPLTAALRDAFEDELRPENDDAIIARAIARATSRLAATPTASAASNPVDGPRETAPAVRSNAARVREISRPRSRVLRLAVPLAAMFAASVALASVYLSTRGTAVPPAPAPSEAPAAPPAKAAEPTRGAAATNLPGEIPSISVSDLPSAKPSAAVTSAHVWSPPPPDSPVTAAELFRDANAERRSGDFTKAASLYAALQKQFPESAETHASRVSLGRLMLDRQADAKGALAQFDAYLNSHATDSTLSEEARLGRALAFQRLGQASAERAAWQDLLAMHPQSLHASRARERLRALDGNHEAP